MSTLLNDTPQDRPTRAPLITRGQVLGMPTVNSNNQQAQTNSWCRYDPLVCLQQAAIESVFLALAYTSVIFVIPGNTSVPKLASLAKFALMFTFINFASRQVSDSLGDKISIGAMGGLSGKLVSFMVPKYTAW